MNAPPHSRSVAAECARFEAAARKRRVLDIPSALAWAGFIGKHRPVDGEHLRRLVDALIATEAAGVSLPMDRVLAALGFAPESEIDWNGALFRAAVLPLMRAAADRRNYARLFWLESHAYRTHVKQRETEDHFRAVAGAWVDIMRAGGQAAAAALPAFAPPLPDAPRRLAFVLVNACMLAHVEAMLAVLEGAVKLAFPATLSVHCLHGKDAALSSRLAALGVSEHCHEAIHPELKGDRYRLLLALRDRLRVEGTDAAIWVSYVEAMPFAFAMRVAPVQIWWALKYHSLSFPEVDGYVTGGGLERFREIDGRRWRNGLLGKNDWFDPRLSEKAAGMRQAIGVGRVLLGVMAREEKMRDPDYLDAVVRILRRHPQALFLWCGRQQDPAVENALREGGVSGQSVFLGWVDTRLFAQVFDIFLDTFPFPCGYTLYQSMAAGMPIVQLDRPETRTYGVAATVLPLLEGERGEAGDQALMQRIFSAETRGDLFPMARSVDEYVEIAGRLIEDAAYRRQIGSAGKRFIDAFFSDSARMAASYLNHFIEIVEERAGHHLMGGEHA